MERRDEIITGRYDELVASGALRFDAAQREIAVRLSALCGVLVRRHRTGSIWSSGLCFWRVCREPARGLYIHGAVGRGKTMLMDLFFALAPDLPKRRLHFHEFMAETHACLHRLRSVGHGQKGDLIPLVADEIASHARLLCFDEFQVNDVADAMILGRLFEKLLACGVVIVATSNSAPDELYRDGINRFLFLPFIDLLRERLDVLCLEARGDYRLELSSGAGFFIHPLGPDATRRMDLLWRRLIDGLSRMSRSPPGAPDDRKWWVRGRTGWTDELSVSLREAVAREGDAAMGAVRLGFGALCGQPLGAADYLSLVRGCHTLFLDDVPFFSPSRRDQAIRFVNLVDSLYDHHVTLVISAAAAPAGIFPEDGEHRHLFARAASRLVEMDSESYLKDSPVHEILMVGVANSGDP